MQSNCRRCKLSQSRRCIVRPRGPSPADAVFIIDAPSAADERLKEVGRTPQGRLITAMMEGAAEMLGVSVPAFKIIPQVFCRPATASDMDRPPARDELLACIPNVIEAVELANPSAIFFFGAEVADYWKKEFPEGKTLLPLWLLEKQGGQQSPNFTITVRTIAEGLQNDPGT